VVKEPLPGGDNDRFAKIFERLAKLPAGHKPRCLASIIFPYRSASSQNQTTWKLLPHSKSNY